VQVTVIGAGSTGLGIAQMSATAGHDVRLDDIDAGRIEDSTEAVVVRDGAGFASSRLGIAPGLEATRMVESGVAGVEDVDTAVQIGYGYLMGPLLPTDHVGLDVRLDIAEHLCEELCERARAPQLLRRKVRAGDPRSKTGEGFYVREDGKAVRPASGAARFDQTASSSRNRKPEKHHVIAVNCSSSENSLRSIWTPSTNTTPPNRTWTTSS